MGKEYHTEFVEIFLILMTGTYVAWLLHSIYTGCGRPGSYLVPPVDEGHAQMQLDRHMDKAEKRLEQKAKDKAQVLASPRRQEKIATKVAQPQEPLLFFQGGNRELPAATQRSQPPKKLVQVQNPLRDDALAPFRMPSNPIADVMREGELTLESFEDVSATVRVCRFSTAEALEVLQSPTWCLACKAPVGKDGTDYTRMYSPIDQGAYNVDLLVKHYEIGRMSSHIFGMKIGDTLKFTVEDADGLVYIPNMMREVALVVGGKAITRVMQLIKMILTNPEDKTQVKLVYANDTESDILLREPLDALAAKYAQFTVVHILSDPIHEAGAHWSKLWTGERGFVDKAFLQKYMPPAEQGVARVKIYVCGPPPMVDDLVGANVGEEVGGALKELGYVPKQVHVFRRIGTKTWRRQEAVARTAVKKIG